MTTVIYHEGILAADQRTTHGGDGFGCAHRKRHCSKCATPTEKTFSYRSKVEAFRRPMDDRKFNGEHIIAWATSGCGVTGEAFDKAIKKGMNLSHAADMCSAIRGIGKGRSCRAILVTTEKVYEVKFGNLFSWKEVTEFPFAIGSGGAAAELAAKRFGYTAQGAVACAMDVDDSTGGKINYVVCREEAGEVTRQIEEIEYSKEELFNETQ